MRDSSQDVSKYSATDLVRAALSGFYTPNENTSNAAILDHFADELDRACEGEMNINTVYRVEVRLRVLAELIAREEEEALSVVRPVDHGHRDGTNTDH